MKKPDSIYDIIEPGLPPGAQDGTPFQWKVGYQGETEFELSYLIAPKNHRLDGRRVRFRYGKVPWKFSWEPKSYWNYPDEAAFELSGPNASHGMLTMGIHPVPRHVLALFRRHHYATAITGYWCSHSRTFIPLQPEEAPETWEECLHIETLRKAA